ncbi:molybdenum cofactor guanylyltransferase [Spirochaetota bacterium]
MTSEDSISAFILAGGKSKRFGQDKSKYLYKNKPLIKHAYDALSPVFDDISIIGNEASDYDIPGIKIYSDIIPGLGPIGGIYTALNNSKAPRSFICPCDMPFINSEFIEYMVSIPNEYDLIIPEVSGFLEPLHAIYSKNCITPLKSLIDNKINKVIEIVDKVELRKVNEDEITFFDDPEKIFQNINYMEDIEWA